MHTLGQIGAGSSKETIWHNRSMCRCIYSEVTSFAGGLGGSKPTQRGARGAAPARIHVTMRHKQRDAVQRPLYNRQSAIGNT